MIVRKNHSNLWGMKGMTVKQVDFVLGGGNLHSPARDQTHAPCCGCM